MSGGKPAAAHPIRSLLDPASRDVKNVFQFPLLFAHNQYFYPFIYAIIDTPLLDKLSAEDRSF